MYACMLKSEIKLWMTALCMICTIGSKALLEVPRSTMIAHAFVEARDGLSQTTWARCGPSCAWCS